MGAMVADGVTSPEYALDIVNLSKRFRRQTVRRSGYTTFKSLLLAGLGGCAHSGPVVYTEAIKDLTLRIPQGSSVGIIGRNGSGKSTLLKLITGIYKPDLGHVNVNGRVAALIELGAGFHPDFTGRENVYLGGVMYGLTRAEIDQRFDAIVRFAELEQVIDDPVRTYSSGMFMRLGFSLAVHTEPDVLLVDEVLAVGDAAFVSKCKDRLSELRRAGITLLLVSHDLEAVERWCDEAIWLEAGQACDRGDPRRVIDAYRHFLEIGEERGLREEPSADPEEQVDVGPASLVATPQRWGSREVEITAVRLRSDAGIERQLFHPDDEVVIEIEFCRHEPVGPVVFGIGVNRNDGLVIHGSNTDLERVVVPDLPSHGCVRYRIERLGLLAGAYQLDVAVHRRDEYPFDYHKGVVQFLVRAPEGQLGVVALLHQWEFDWQATQ